LPQTMNTCLLAMQFMCVGRIDAVVNEDFVFPL